MDLFIEPDDEEFNCTMKIARRKLEIPMPAAMPWKTSLCRSSRETLHKTKYACSVEADASMRIRMEGAPPLRYHEYHMAGKDMKSSSHCNLVHKLIPMPQAKKIPDAKAAVENEGENSRKYRHGS